MRIAITYPITTGRMRCLSFPGEVGGPVVSAKPEPPAPRPVTQSAGFWPLMGYAAALGVFGGFAGLVFLG